MLTTRESLQDSSKPVTPGAVTVLNRVLDAALFNKKVARAHTDGDIVYGIARRIGDQSGSTLSDRDIRDQFLWVTTKTGFEVFWPVSELANELFDGTFSDDYDWS